jgi:hypothetical protein
MFAKETKAVVALSLADLMDSLKLKDRLLSV